MGEAISLFPSPGPEYHHTNHPPYSSRKMIMRTKYPAFSNLRVASGLDPGSNDRIVLDVVPLLSISMPGEKRVVGQRGVKS